MSSFTFQEKDDKEVVQLVKSLDGRKSAIEDGIIASSCHNSCFPNDAQKHQFAE